MAEYDIPFSALIQRPSPTTRTRRNAEVTACDDFTITVTMYADEDSNAPQTTIGAWAVLSVYDLHRTWGPNFLDRWFWDYGFWGSFSGLRRPILQIYNQPISDPSLGQMVFAFAPTATQHLKGRYAFEVEYEGNGAGACVVRGTLEVAPGALFAQRDGFVLDDGSGDGSYLDGPDTLSP